MSLIAYLKKTCPKSFEEFRTGYLRNNYEYWEEGGPKYEILWFCSLPERMQIGYFLDYLFPADSKAMIAPRAVIDVIKGGFDEKEREFKDFEAKVRELESLYSNNFHLGGEIRKLINKK